MFLAPLERLDVTTVIFANRSYGILSFELGRIAAVPATATIDGFMRRAS